MIIEPLNDRACLGALSQRAAEAVTSPPIIQLADQVGDARELARFLRTLPQRDDDGTDRDAPTVQCDVPQRARFAALDPNCVERAITYLAAAERIDPRPWRQLATVDTSAGRHTFPVEDGLPVVLDPAVPRNALHAGVLAIRNTRGLSMSPAETLRWILDLADGEARTAEQRDRVARTRATFDAVLQGLAVAESALRDIGVTLALAERAARGIGEQARRNVCSCAHALEALQTRRNALGFRWGGRRFNVSVNWPMVRSLGSALGPTAVTAAATAAGIPLPVATAVGQVVAQTLSQESHAPHEAPRSNPSAARRVPRVDG